MYRVNGDRLYTGLTVALDRKINRTISRGKEMATFYINFCIIYFSLAEIKHHDKVNL